MQVMCKQREQIPASFMGRKREHPPKNRGISASASPPKAEATGSNPVGCASFLIYASFSNGLSPSLANRLRRLAINIAAAASESAS